jgi:NADH-quinone oxidoreductase subunit M
LDSYYLSIIVFLPIAGALFIAFWPKLSTKQIKLFSLFFCLVTFGFSLAIFAMFDRHGGFQFEQSVSWIPAIQAHYHLGVDGLSLPMVLLTAFLGLVAVLVSWRIDKRPREYFAWLLVLETGILGVFSSLDLILFFLFWEIELIPMYMLISIWGSGRKEYSAMKFVIYTLIGSALMLAGILLLYFKASPFMDPGQSPLDMVALSQAGLNTDLISVLPAIFFLILAAFAIKLPVFPLHTWLPDAHTDAPTAVSVILAGALLKMGGYGMIRICVSIFPDVAHKYSAVLAAFAVVSVIYGAAVTMRQKDLKRLIAYSSVSHMGYVMLGIFALSQVSLTGATLQMFSHGIVTGLLFAMVGLVYDKTHNRNLDQLGGLARQMPVIAVVFSIAGLASLGLPGTSGFAAEFITFVGSFTSTLLSGAKLFTLLAAAGVVLAAGYILWTLQRTFYGPPLERYDHVPDANNLEKVPIFALVVAIMIVGVYPAFLTDVIKGGINIIGANTHLFGV